MCVFLKVGFYVGEMCRYILSTPPSHQDKQHCMGTLLGIGMRMTMWKKFVDRFQIPNIIELYGATEGNVIIGTYRCMLCQEKVCCSF